MKTKISKTTAKTGRTTRAFEKAIPAQGDRMLEGKFLLRLYVAGATERSRQAIVRARALCEAQLAGNYDLEVIDVYQQPGLAREGQIIATPTLVREFPLPLRRLIGNLTDGAGLFGGLGLDRRGKPPL